MTGPGVVEFELTATRVGVRYGDGHIYVKEGALNSGWVDMGDFICSRNLTKLDENWTLATRATLANAKAQIKFLVGKSRCRVP
jgi:hypothetical protein